MVLTCIIQWIERIFWGAIIFLYLIVPFALHSNASVRQHVIFSPYFNQQWFKNLSSPQDFGLNCALHFYIPSSNRITLGTWYIPAEKAACDKKSINLEEEISDDRPVFLYVHGKAQTRGENHRVDLYKVLSEKVNAHVIAFDYRGFGDSSDVIPDQRGTVDDTLHVFNWLKKYVDSNRIFIWGHSLGTGIATALLHDLTQKGETVAGLILQAPFATFTEALRAHPLSIFHRYTPLFDLIFDVLARETDLLNCISNICFIKSPILILHAEDDAIIPFAQGRKLYEHALTCRQTKSLTKFHGFDEGLGYGHKYICKDERLPAIVMKFIDEAKKY